jgi:tRNA A37 methylthiotransferase MiaB
MKRVFLKLNTCYRRQLDVARFSKFLTTNGINVVSSIDHADTVVLWGCAFNTSQEKQSLSLAQECVNSGKNVFVLEGVSEVARHELVELGIPDRHIFSFLDEFSVNENFGRDTAWADIPGENRYYQMGGPFSVQTGHGCRDRCTYCGDKPIVGELISRPLETVLSEISEGVAGGAPVIELLGDDVGAYGLDINQSLSGLLYAIGARHPGVLISMREVNIKHLIHDLDEIEKALQFVQLQNMVVAFQSGSNRILEQMRRGYTASGILALLQMLDRHQVYYHLHIIAGFPTETPEEFQESLDILKQVDFYSCTLFKYQDRRYTDSSKLEPKVADEEVLRRFSRAEQQFAGRYTVDRKEDKLQLVRQTR